MTKSTVRKPFPPIVSVVGFHHAKGPDVEHWFGGNEDPEDTCTDEEWPFFPFMALTDGSHGFEQDFSYFTLKREARGDRPASSLFAISCTMQLDARLLKEKKAEVTRSTVQKAVVVITDSPVYFGHLREQLVMVTSAWFAQRNFDDLEIIKKFRESLVRSLHDRDDGFDREAYLGLSLREFIYRFRQNALVLFKCALLQPKMLFFSSKSCEKLCMTQFSLVSLIPGLLENLSDASDPEMNTYEEGMIKATSLRQSDRKSLLHYMGCPLQIFGKGSLFGPYTPLQQLDLLADKETKSYIVGSTNSLLLQQKDRYSDIIVNLDDLSINITSTYLRNALALTPADRRWINTLIQTVVDSWDDADPSRPKTLGFSGSEDFIRLQFEEYILGLLAAVKYSNYLTKHGDEALRLADIEGDPAVDYGIDWIHHWKTTENYRIFEKFTEDNLFDVIVPRHVYAGARAYEELTRRINQHVAELKLDEKVTAGRAAVSRTLATGSRKVSSAISSFWADMERARKEREAQQRQLEEMEKYNAELLAHEEKLRSNSRPASIRTVDTSGVSIHENSPTDASYPPSITGSNVTSAPASAPTGAEAGVGSRASSYLSSWASWAGEKRRKAWGASPVETSPPAPTSATSSPTGGAKASTYQSLNDKNDQQPNGTQSSRSSLRTVDDYQPLTEEQPSTANATSATDAGDTKRVSKVPVGDASEGDLKSGKRVSKAPDVVTEEVVLEVPDTASATTEAVTKDTVVPVKEVDDVKVVPSIAPVLIRAGEDKENEVGKGSEPEVKDLGVSAAATATTTSDAAASTTTPATTTVPVTADDKRDN